MYEIKPTMLVLAGGFSLAMFDNGLGIFSGAILLLAGVEIFNMRINNRKE